MRDTSRNSEKPSPNANSPPTDRQRREESRGGSSDTRNSLEELLRLTPEGRRWRTDRRKKKEKRGTKM